MPSRSVVALDPRSVYSNSARWGGRIRQWLLGGYPFLQVQRPAQLGLGVGDAAFKRGQPALPSCGGGWGDTPGRGVGVM